VRFITWVLVPKDFWKQIKLIDGYSRNMKCDPMA
jgi:hypothetical protein